jgi:DNA-binding NtrC family response regulator
MLVLGDAEKIADELFETVPNKLNQSKHSAEINISPSSHSILNFNGSDLLQKGSFSLKSIKKDAVDKIEKEVISYVLGRTEWNRSKAAKILKISYKTMLNKISELNIDPPDGIPQSEDPETP